MRYMGGKSKIAYSLVGSMLADGCPREVWFEPFVGGANVTVEALPWFKKALCFDAHEDLILMWQALAGGWVPEDVTEESYQALRKAAPSAQRAFAGFGGSFGGKWFGGYGYRNSKVISGAWEEAARSLLAHSSSIFTNNVSFELASFGEVDPPEGATVYCDPPYLGTTGYSAALDADNYLATLVRWVDELGCSVYCSERSQPEGVKTVLVWSGAKRLILKVSDNSSFAPEVLYKVLA